MAVWSLHFSVNPNYRPGRTRLDWYKQNHDDDYLIEKAQEAQSATFEDQFRALRKKLALITVVKLGGLGCIIGVYCYTDNLWILGLAAIYLIMLR